jgi:glutamate-1-semialdehyde 2,1-aminomutase
MADVVVVEWNDFDALERCLDEHGADVAAVIMEPVMGNAGVNLPRDGYLHTVREMIHDRGGLLIFDEVITGMRVAAGGAQEYFLVTPDITVISKAVGGGYPIGAFGASVEIMNTIVSGRLFHGGVFSGNAIVMAAAEAVLDTVLGDRAGIYRCLHSLGDQLAGGMHEIMARLGVPHQVHHVGPLVSLLLTKGEVDDIHNYRHVRRHCDFDRYIEFQHHLQRAGIYFHPNQFEPMFLSTAHTADDVAIALDRVEEGARKCLLR